MAPTAPEWECADHADHPSGAHARVVALRHQQSPRTIGQMDVMPSDIRDDPPPPAGIVAVGWPR